LLIGFWYEKDEAAAAGKKAFLVNRVGDFGFMLAVFLIWTSYGALNFHDTPEMAGVLGQQRLAGELPFVGGATATAICLLLLLGACGKSAQFPLHVWLPDAMEGPTPVSALIHAATMVTAGVYMVARCAPLFHASPTAQWVVAATGGFTALLAGLIALTQFDLKRILAYSTISQLGYMFLALGSGTAAGITAGMFHLFTHAFFKALLFLGAGSVMHAMGGVIDIRRFGGLRHIMPWTHRTFLVGCLALAGIFPFAGFWSKDQILAAVHQPTLAWLYSGAVVTAFLTALYTFRAYLVTFFGPLVVPDEAGHHAHESPPLMLLPLCVLAVCAFGVGFVFETGDTFAHFLETSPSLAYLLPENGVEVEGSHFHWDVAVTSTVVALSGIGLAAFLYLGPRREVEALAARLRLPRQLSYRKFYFDELYLFAVVWPLRLVATISYALDRWFVDGLVDLGGQLPVWLGQGVRRLQRGLLPFYGLMMALGTLVILGLGGLWWFGG
jgi:NADH-quinone oxidoreductase subunit L